MTLYFDDTGPLLQYEDGALIIQDLNPEIKTTWRLSRWQMFKLGMRALRASA